MAATPWKGWPATLSNLPSSAGVQRKAQTFLPACCSAIIVLPTNFCTLTFSRDAQSALLRVLTEVISSVRSGAFLPDETRSGRLVGELPPLKVSTGHRGPSAQSPVETWSDDRFVLIDGDDAFPEYASEPTFVQDAASQGAASVADTDASSSTSDSDSTSSDEGAGELEKDELAASLASRPPQGPALDSSDEVFQHVKLGTLHLRRLGGMSKLACGRLLHEGFVRRQHALAFPWPKCTQCFGRGSEPSVHG